MTKVRKWLKKRRYQPTFSLESVTSSARLAGTRVEFETAAQQFVPFDENLLERCRTQWQFGDWASLVGISRNTLQHHPDRAKLALLVASGYAAIGNATEARHHTRLAIDWGCSKKLVSQILISGVYNTLGRAAAASGQQRRALKNFEGAIAVGAPGGERRLTTQARVSEQLAQLQLPECLAALENDVLSHSRLRVIEIPNANNSDNIAIQITPEAREQLKSEIKLEVNADIKANTPNPYVHNRTLTPPLNKALRDFAEVNLKRNGLKAAYIDYLASKAIQIERNCLGRLATTVQDAVARQLVAECIPGDRLCILEIGALYGVSLAILYNHGVSRYAQVEVACLDPFDGYYGQAIDAVLNSPVNDLTFMRNMQLANVPKENFHLIKHYSTDPAAIVAAGELSINLLVIDGDHSYEGVKFDFDNYYPLLQPGGYVIFDDYNATEWPGVQRFIDEDVCKTADLEYLGAFSRTAVARKRLMPVSS